MRSCDAFGVTKLVLIAPKFKTIDTPFEKSSASAIYWVDTVRVDSVEECRSFFRREHPEVDVMHVATTPPIENKTVLYTSFNFAAAESPVAVWFGNEARGLSPAALCLCAEHNITIDMRGMVESLNLSVSAGVVIAEATRQRSSVGMENFLLSASDQEKLVERIHRRVNASDGGAWNLS